MRLSTDRPLDPIKSPSPAALNLLTGLTPGNYPHEDLLYLDDRRLR